MRQADQSFHFFAREGLGIHDDGESDLRIIDQVELIDLNVDVHLQPPIGNG